MRALAYVRTIALVSFAASALAACDGTEPTYTSQPDSSAATTADSVAPRATNDPTTGVDVQPTEASTPFSPCISSERVSSALGLGAMELREPDFGSEDEFLCTYLSDAGTMLDVYVLPRENHREMSIAKPTDSGESPQPEERDIVIAGATDAHGYLATPGVDVRFDAGRAYLVLDSRMPSTTDGLDRTVAVAELFAADLGGGSE